MKKKIISTIIYILVLFCIILLAILGYDGFNSIYGNKQGIVLIWIGQYIVLILIATISYVLVMKRGK